MLKLAQLRGQTESTNEAIILALLVAWALLQGEIQDARDVLTQAASQWAASLSGGEQAAPCSIPTVSSWTLTALAVQTLRIQVQGYWTQARLHQCLPLLQRFVCGRRKRRVHQESTMRRDLLAHLASIASASSSLFSCSSA